jgi:hypothetical protein
MIQLPGGLLRSFRSLLRQSAPAGGRRAPRPAVLCQATSKGLCLSSSQGDVALRHLTVGPFPADCMALPGELLAELEGLGVLSLEQTAPFKARAVWQQGESRRVREFDTADPSTLPAPSALPRGYVPMPAGFLKALAEAAKTASRESGAVALRQPGRGALCRVLLRAGDGAVVASDGLQLLVQAGFPFPWKGDVLIPALPAFASRQLSGEPDVRVGRQGKHLLLQVGSWLWQLPAEAARGYPDVNSAIPPAGGKATRLRLDAADISLLLEALPRLPGLDEEHSPVTLALGAAAIVRAGEGSTREVPLARSRVLGPAVQVAMDRRYLLRALRLGFTELEVASADRPIVCRDGQRTYVWMPLDVSPAVSPGRTPRVVPDRRESERTEAMPTPDDRNGQPIPPGGEADALAEAEALRLQLQDALARTARLIAALKQQRRQGRAVQAAVASLRKLQQLGG